MHMPPVDKHARWPENHKFTGAPSAEIDGNWMDLTEDRYFSISEEEAIEAWGDRRHEYVDEVRGGYTAGLDVFHTLHCLVSLFLPFFSSTNLLPKILLVFPPFPPFRTQARLLLIAYLPISLQNHVRMALYPDHYKHEGTPLATQTAHTEHCLDALRQHVMCYGSTTLIPTQWRAGLQQQYIDANQEHVCRDFSHLRNFVRMRGMEGELYVPRDKSLLLGKGTTMTTTTTPPPPHARPGEGELKEVEGDHAA